MLKQKYIQDVLNKFGRSVVQQSRSRLTKQKKNATKDLYNSVNYELDVSNRGTSFSFSFSMEEYGEYIDKGVSGVDVKYNTPYAYTTKAPPPSVFQKWAKAKGIKPRDKKTGKFITAKQFGFIMSRHIFTKGQKPTRFFSLSFEQQFKKLPDDLLNAFGDGLEDFLNFKI